MDKVRYNLACSECHMTNSWGVFDSSRLRWCPKCQKNTMHYPNDSYVISDDVIVEKVKKMIKEDNEKNDISI